MATYQELKDLSEVRLREAEALFAANLFDGCAYLAGYVVELALKARICKLLGINEYLDSGKLGKVYAVHDLDQLLLLSGLRGTLDPTNVALFNNWSISVPWNPERRYEPVGSVTRQDALDILNAIRDGTDGVYTWIKMHW